MQDFDYVYQQAMSEMHVLPSDFDDQDYYRMAEIMNAKKKEDRPLSTMAYLRSIGMDPDNIADDQQGKGV